MFPWPWYIQCSNTESILVRDVSQAFPIIASVISTSEFHGILVLLYYIGIKRIDLYDRLVK